MDKIKAEEHIGCHDLGRLQNKINEIIAVIGKSEPTEKSSFVLCLTGGLISLTKLVSKSYENVTLPDIIDDTIKKIQDNCDQNVKNIAEAKRIAEEIKKKLRARYPQYEMYVNEDVGRIIEFFRRNSDKLH